MNASQSSIDGLANSSTSRKYNVECTVKCPRCKKIWKFKSTRILIPPKYKYCKRCEAIATNIGGYEGRGVHRGKGGRPPATLRPQREP